MGSICTKQNALIKLSRCLLPAAITSIGVVFLSEVYDASAPYGSTTDISSAAFFPGLIALFVTALGVALLLSTWRLGGSSTETIPSDEEPADNHRAWSAYGLIVSLAVGMPWLGIWLTAMLGVPLLASLFGERRWWVLALLAFVPAVLVIHLFEGLMGVYFPRGELL